MSEAIVSTFRKLCQQAWDADEHTLHAPDVEPILVTVLQLVNNHPEERTVFVQLFLEVADGQIQTPWYLLPFCMFELRYPEIYEHLKQEYAEGYANPRFARRFGDIRQMLDLYEGTDEHFQSMWPYYNRQDAPKNVGDGQPE
jgi:hypothetical protein